MTAKTVSTRVLATVAVASLFVVGAVLFGASEGVVIVLALAALGCVAAALYLDKARSRR